MNEWNDDLKRILRKATETENHAVFLFTDTQVKQESFVEDLNNLLNAGEVPNLFPPDEKQEVCEKMRLLDRQRERTKQTDGSPVALFNFFIQKTREQLHVVLAFSPVGAPFRMRLRMFPSLVNCCTIDWFQVRIFKLQSTSTSAEDVRISRRTMKMTPPCPTTIAKTTTGGFIRAVLSPAQVRVPAVDTSTPCPGRARSNLARVRFINATEIFSMTSKPFVKTLVF